MDCKPWMMLGGLAGILVQLNRAQKPPREHGSTPDWVWTRALRPMTDASWTTGGDLQQL